MGKNVKIAIIGAGSAGLSAFHSVKKETDDLVVIEDGIWGTTCARVGCMPSKAIIQIANHFDSRKKFAVEGIHGSESLNVDLDQVMERVRALRDRFVRGVLGTMEEIGDRNIKGRARFVKPNVLQVAEEQIEADSIIIATGTTPTANPEWWNFKQLWFTTDTFFELQKLPKQIAVLGTGVIGLELGQALHRLGVDVRLFGRSGRVAGLTDPVVNEEVVHCLKSELTLDFVNKLDMEPSGKDRLKMKWDGGGSWECDRALVALGRTPNLGDLGLKEIGVSLDENGVPLYDPQTMQVGDHPIWIAGDVNDDLTLLHEASDEGRIAGYNAVHKTKQKFKRRVPLQIAFCSPDVAVVGTAYKNLDPEKIEMGEVGFKGQGRSIIMQMEKGKLRVYCEKGSGKVVGAELAGPHGEHLAHLIAWAMEAKMSCFDMLSLPFYHPVVEEGLRTALRDAARKVDKSRTVMELRKID